VQPNIANKSDTLTCCQSDLVSSHCLYNFFTAEHMQCFVIFLLQNTCYVLLNVAAFFAQETTLHL